MATQPIQLRFRLSAGSITLPLFVAILALGFCEAYGDIAANVRSLTGNRSRLVWSQDQNNSDFRGYDANDRLFGFDTDDGKGIRQICPDGDCGTFGYTKPLFTGDGQRIVFSNRDDNNVYVVNFDGSNKRTITKGLAACVRTIGGTHWAYIRKGDNEQGDAGSDIRRYNIDSPSQEEIVWTNTDVGNNHQIWFSVSGDGKRAAGTFPWSTAKAVILPNGNYVGSSGGCWASMAPDNSYSWWIFEGNHQKVKMFNASGSQTATVAVNNTPATSGKEVYYPRWTNHARFIVMCGPGVGGATSDVYIGKLAADLESAGSWVRITDNAKADIYADGWISSSTANKAATPSFTPSTAMFVGSLSVTLTCATSGATIRYTLDGSEPIESSAAYSSSFTLNQTTTIKARAFRSGFTPSDVATKTYTLTDPPELTDVRVEPLSATIAPGGTFTFEATALDQYGNAFSPQPDIIWSVSDNQTIGSTSGTFTAPDTPGGPYAVTAAATADGITRSGTAEITVASIHIKVNAGGEAASGWQAQNDYATAGADFSTSSTIDLSGAGEPAPEEVYQTCRHQEPAFTFADLTNGYYTVRLHFAEPGNPDVGARQMDIIIEGSPVLTGFDVLAEAGATRKAIVKEFDVEIADGNGLTIKLENGSGNDSYICGIEVIATSQAPTPLTVLSPNGGESYAPGQTVDITWETADPMIAGCVIQFSSDEGKSWKVIHDGSIDRGKEGWESYSWTIPTDDPSVVSSTCLIMVHEYNKEETNDISDAAFSIGSNRMGRHTRTNAGSDVRPFRIHTSNSGVLELTVQSSRGSHCLGLFSTAGRQLYRAEGHGAATYRLPVGSVTTGTMVLKLSVDNKTFVRRIVLQQ